MGKDYTEKEYRKLIAMQEKEFSLRGKSFNGWYIFLSDGYGKFPKWSVCDVDPYKHNTVKAYEFNSFKKAYEFTQTTPYHNITN